MNLQLNYSFQSWMKLWNSTWRILGVQAPSFLQLSEDVGSLDPERVFGDLNLDVRTLEFNEHPVYMDDYIPA